MMDFSSKYHNMRRWNNMKLRKRQKCRDRNRTSQERQESAQKLEVLRVAAMSLSGTSLREWFSARRQTIQPWGQFLSMARFTKPNSVATAGSRVVKNIEHFQSNYVFVFLILAIYCILTSPMLLIALGGLFGACYYISVKNQNRKLKIGSYELTLAQQYGAVALLSFPLFFLVGGGSAIFWVIGASFFFIMLHAVFYNPASPQIDEIQMEEVSFGSA